MKYYLTTPIYYVNATPHIGHAYTTLVADTVKRVRRMMGDEAYLSTGTDEHGQKVERSAEKAGWTAQEFADRVSGAFRAEWDSLGIDYDFFVRTTEPRHARAVQWLFERCRQNGFIKKDTYTGKYDVSGEAFVTDEEAEKIDGPVEVVTEENYFFKLSEFQDRLLKHYEDNPAFIRPESRRNEVISFVKGGLKDLSISRANLKWGIPLPGDDGHVFYVWFDALTNYITALGYGSDGEVDPKGLWPADVHIVGKEIVRFHAVYWPAFLMAAGLPLPKAIYAHGWLIFQEEKMSKTKGNVVRAKPIDQVVGIEGLRHYLLREIVFGQDGNFSYEGLVGRYNADLANGLGNLASRTLAMIHRYFDGAVPEPPAASGGALAKQATETIAKVRDHFEAFEFSRGLDAIWALSGAVDKYLVEQKPWVLIKGEDEATKAQLRATLYNAAEVLRIVTALASPVLPKAAAEIWRQLGQESALNAVRYDGLRWGQLKPGTKLPGGEAVFPRLDVEASITKMRELEQEVLKEQAAIMGKTAAGFDWSTLVPLASKEQAAIMGKTAAAAPAAREKPADSERIEIDDFAKVEMRVGVVRTAEKVKKADKLLHLTIDIGEAEPRSIMAGIAAAYEPESLIGRKVAIVANLKPRKLRGLVSDGMIIAASGEDGNPNLVSFLEDAPIGARLG